jgi:hypothetical protein
MRGRAWLLLASSLAGCTGKPEQPSGPAPQSVSLNVRQVSLAELAGLPEKTERPSAPTVPTTLPATTSERVHSRAPAAPRDAAPSPQLFYHLFVFRIAAPLGTISGNEMLWKPVDEQVVSPATYDLLWKNGIRVGTAPREGRRHHDQHRENNPDTISSVVGFEAQHIELAATRDIPQQNVFYLDQQNTLHGRSFDRCDNVLYLSFNAAPRRPGLVRITLSPAVLSFRKRLEYSLSSDRGDREIRFFAPKTYYDVNLRVDLPMDRFLLVAPSPEASIETSLGHLFFTTQTPTERLERAFVIMVKARPVEGALPPPSK